MAAFTDWHDTSLSTSWLNPNTAGFWTRFPAVKPLWKSYRERDRLRLASVGAGTRGDERIEGPRGYLTTAARASLLAASRPLRGSREFAYKRPRKGGIVPIRVAC